MQEVDASSSNIGSGSQKRPREPLIPTITKKAKCEFMPSSNNKVSLIGKEATSNTSGKRERKVNGLLSDTIWHQIQSKNKEVALIKRKLDSIEQENNDLKKQLIEGKANKSATDVDLLAAVEKIGILEAKIQFATSQENKQQNLIQQQESDLKKQKFCFDEVNALFEKSKQEYQQNIALAEQKSRNKIEKLTELLDMQKQKDKIHANELQFFQNKANTYEEERKRSRAESIALQECKIKLENTQYQLQEKMRQNELEKQTEQSYLVLRDQMCLDSKTERKLRAAMETIKSHNSEKKINSLLQEKIHGLEETITRHKLMRQQYAKLQASNEIFQEKIQEWETTLGPFCSNNETVPTPRNITALIEEIQQDKVILALKNGELERGLKQNENKLITMQQKLLINEKNKKVADDLLSYSKEELKCVQIKLQNMTQQKGAIKNVMGTSGIENNSLICDKQQIEKVKQLENALVFSQKKIIELEANTQNLERKHEKVLKQLEKTEKEAAYMESQLIRGEYNPRNTKILHFAANPEKIARQEAKSKKIKELTKENMNLKSQISILKGKNISQSTNADQIRKNEGNIHNGIINPERIRKLEAAVKEGKLKMDRLKKVFYKTISTFRGACYELTGYKIQMKKMNNKDMYVLRSMFAERESDELIFARNDRGDLQVLETDYCKTVNSLTLNILSQRKCIPAFISQITLDLFAATTQNF